MKCGCGGILKVTHTYVVPKTGRTLSAKCQTCAKRTTMVQFMVEGASAQVLAKRLEAGTVVPILKE